MDCGKNLRQNLILEIHCVIVLSSVKKGDRITIPIVSLNRAKRFWGEDALEFKCA